MLTPLKLARALAAEHEPVGGRCPACTRLGVGNHGGMVPGPCDIYREAMARRRRLGDPDLELRPDGTVAEVRGRGQVG